VSIALAQFFSVLLVQSSYYCFLPSRVRRISRLAGIFFFRCPTGLSAKLFISFASVQLCRCLVFCFFGWWVRTCSGFEKGPPTTRRRLHPAPSEDRIGLCLILDVSTHSVHHPFSPPTYLLPFPVLDTSVTYIQKRSQKKEKKVTGHPLSSSGWGSCTAYFHTTLSVA